MIKRELLWLTSVAFILSLLYNFFTVNTSYMNPAIIFLTILCPLIIFYLLSMNKSKGILMVLLTVWMILESFVFKNILTVFLLIVLIVIVAQKYKGRDDYGV